MVFFQELPLGGLKYLPIEIWMKIYKMEHSSKLKDIHTEILDSFNEICGTAESIYDTNTGTLELVYNIEINDIF
jgi:hypothetical protein